MSKWIETKLKPWLWAIVHANFQDCQVKIAYPVKIGISWNVDIRFQHPSIRLYLPYWVAAKYAAKQDRPIEEYLDLEDIPF